MNQASKPGRKAGTNESFTIIPAAPGTRLLVPDEDFADHWSTAVIAWRIVTSTEEDPRDGYPGTAEYVEPVTVDSDGFPLPENYAVQHPGSDQVEVPRDSAYLSVAQWLADRRARCAPKAPR